MTILDQQPTGEGTAVRGGPPPNALAAAYRLARYHLTLYRKTWHGTLFSATLMPMLYLVTFGVAVGAYVDDGLLPGGVSYLQFVLPGTLCAMVLMMMNSDLTFPVFGGYKDWGGHYLSQHASPARPVDILNGHMLYVLAFRVPFGCLLFTSVMLIFGVFANPWMAPMAILAAIGVAASIAPWVFFLASWIKRDQNLVIVQRVILVPITLFSGVFFPASVMPSFLLPLVYASPMWHGVEIARYFTAGVETSWPMWTNVVYLVALATAGWFAARHIIYKRLSD
ncbi:ABC transporter permease [Natronoglycomyces albus]|uniref:ABC transporter permease n=1 Tax=Natronoglycomyces albus TaxID=2811108 RepID=A0A895XGB6_9ACTN|nr:ABC transporter permease [Natronoglycomyces albus]QSB04384.1 ABC transporter permease [Natronoglycomyces albus]